MGTSRVRVLATHRFDEQFNDLLRSDTPRQRRGGPGIAEGCFPFRCWARDVGALSCDTIAE
eukprot:2960281-Prymnesium_polylepis.1